MPESHASADTPELVFTRTFDAPLSLVWKMWSEAEHLVHWWGPKGLTMGVARLDLRPGGIFHYSMTTPDGTVMWGRFDYVSVEAPTRLSFINGFSDRDGNYVRHPMSATWPLKVLNDLTLVEQDGRTVLTLRGTPVEANAEELATFAVGTKSVHQGLNGMFDNLDAYLQAQARAQ
jgi:uncharacterized protein YndB with AHSA1/START domain